MRMLLDVKIPTESFNREVREGRATATLNNIIETSRPEAVYFSERDGYRNATLIVNINKSSEIPAYAEPWYLKFDAQVSFHPVMTQEDLKDASLDDLSKKWS